MREAFSRQRRLDCAAIDQVVLNLNCRDEIIPILAALQHLYRRPNTRDEILNLVAADVNRNSRDDCGREGFDYWEILVLAAVRLGCDLKYDRLQDLAENHRSLRHLMGIGNWDQTTSFDWRRIRDNVCLLRAETIERISHCVVATGHQLAPEATAWTRADSFVVETNIHYPSESSLIRDGIRKVLELCAPLASAWQLPGWRQSEHLYKTVKRLSRNIDRIAARKGAGYQQRLQTGYQKLLKRSADILRRARELADELSGADDATTGSLAELAIYLDRTQQVMNTARRRVLEGENVPNEEKLFSIFEPHTQLYKRGKAGQPVQFGRLVLIYEDAAGFITHHHLLPRDANDRDVVLDHTRIVQQRLGGAIRAASFDRGFHSPEIQEELAQIIAHPCLPKPGAKQSAEQASQASVEFRQARQRHSGVESAIGALQAGNGLKRCRDRSEMGFDRYLALGILGRNLQTLGKILIARKDPLCEAAASRRKSAA